MKRPIAAPGQRTPRRHARSKSTIPREFIPLLNKYARDPYHRIELWCYALVLLMVDEEQVRMTRTHEVAGREWVTLEIYGGEEFDIVKPDMGGEESEQLLLDGMRKIVRRVRAKKRRLK